MPFLMRGTLIEYRSEFLGPIPNVVIFQFNPEELERTMEIPARPGGAESRESGQAGDVPVEKIQLTANFSAADRLDEAHPLAHAFGIGMQLAALEKMVHPPGRLARLPQMAVDAVRDAIARRRDEDPTQRIPRQQYPRLLFIWGTTRILPVEIESMVITEEEYDRMLNPVRAKVVLGLRVVTLCDCSRDYVAMGALEYTNMAKDLQAMANIAETVTQVEEIVNF